MSEVPTPSEFRRGYLAYQQFEKRDAMYKTATFLVEHYWDQPHQMADSLGVLLLTWNQAFYRYGQFDYQCLEECIAKNKGVLNAFRTRNILTYSRKDDGSIEALFNALLAALRICEGKKAGTRSPVAVAKALHLLAPDFFPLWDFEIANAYACQYAGGATQSYLRFIRKTKEIAEKLQGAVAGQQPGKPLLKLIDEYNHARFTRKRI